MNQTVCHSISPYIRAEASILVEPKPKAASAPLEMAYGNKLQDGGWLELDDEEVQSLLKQYPELEPYILKLGGGKELLSGKWKHCFWLKDAPKEILANPEVWWSVQRRKEWLLARTSEVERHRRMALQPHLYRDTNRYERALALPRVCPENVRHLPFAFIGADTIANDQMQLVPNADLYVFGIAVSAMHGVWAGGVCGRLGTGLRYSRDMAWNTFPWPDADDGQRKMIASLAEDVLKAREACTGMPLGTMYDPARMPSNLRDAHKSLDKAVDALYRNEGFASDSGRMESLFSLYGRMAEHSFDKGIGRWF